MSSNRPPWLWPLTVIVVVAMALGAFLYVFNTLSRAPRAVAEEGKEMLRGLRDVAAAFQSGTVTTSFTSYATEATGVNRLQVAELSQIELFEQTDEASVLWGQLQLPDVVVRARAPVTYTYYVDLEERWDFALEGNRIRVVAPEIEFNPPAVDVSELDYEVAEDSLLRDEDEALERLRSGISQMSRRRAVEHVPLIRELARRETEQFVANWLAAQFVDGSEFDVEVAFRLEPAIIGMDVWHEESN
jgi:hypothetical protein